MLLYGPPGCGKTLLAREITAALGAREPKIVNGPEMMSKYVGDSEQYIRALFAEAELEQQEAGDESALHVIVFDEIDAFTRERGSLSGDTSGVRDSVVNQLLAKMDGVEQLDNVLRKPAHQHNPSMRTHAAIHAHAAVHAHDAVHAHAAVRAVWLSSVPPHCMHGSVLQDVWLSSVSPHCVQVLIIGLTNRPELIDSALIRPGRMEVKVRVPRPDADGRAQILNIHTSQLRERRCLNERSAAALASGALASVTDGFSGADLAGLMRSATSFALERCASTHFLCAPRASEWPRGAPVSDVQVRGRCAAERLDARRRTEEECVQLRRAE